MAKQHWLKMDDHVSEIINNWKWQEATVNPQTARYEQKYEGIRDDNCYDPAYYHYSYSEWRTKRAYYRTPTDGYYKDYITSLMPLRIGGSPTQHPNQECQNIIYGAIDACVRHNIACTHLLVGTLYSSYHLVSPYILPTLKYLLSAFEGDLQYNVTSISNPRYTVAHIAAMSDDPDLLSIYFDLGGNIDAIDGSNFSPLYISLGKRNFKTAHKLLWMNAVVNERLTVTKLAAFGLRHLMNVVACLQHFLFEIELDIGKLFSCLHQQTYDDAVDGINKDLIQCIVSFVLPVQTYQGIKRVLSKLENDEIETMQIKYEHVMRDANKCLDLLIDVKKELLPEQQDDDDDDALYPYPFGLQKRDVFKINDDRFVNKMVMVNLFALSMSDEEEIYRSTKWTHQVKRVLSKPKKRALLFYTLHQDAGNAKTMKTMVIGSVIVGIAVILARKLLSR